MTNDSLVSIVNTTVYGRSKKYRLEDTSEVTLVQWVVETKQLGAKKNGGMGAGE